MDAYLKLLLHRLSGYKIFQIGLKLAAIRDSVARSHGLTTIRFHDYTLQLKYTRCLKRFVSSLKEAIPGPLSSL